MAIIPTLASLEPGDAGGRIPEGPIACLRKGITVQPDLGESQTGASCLQLLARTQARVTGPVYLCAQESPYAAFVFHLKRI